ncbi:MAG: class I SAM-dependent methyltransferase [Bacteroidia bacterium]
MQHEAFDAYAPAYDDHFTQTRIGIAQRGRVHKLLVPLLKNCSTITEINCGTGEDALMLAKRGLTVYATDGAPGMVQTAKHKNAACKNVVVSTADLRMPEQLPPQKVDLIFSNFGGLNCLSPEEVRRLAPELKKRLIPGGIAVLVIMGRKCWWERFYFTLKRDKRKYRRKSQTPAAADIGGQIVNTWYYSPNEFAALFAPYFEVKNAEPVGLFIPPSYLEPFFARKSFLFSVLVALDRLLAHGSWCADAADHYLIVLKQREV